MGKARYIEVPAETLFTFLEEKGFEKSTQYREVVYVRRHHRDPRYSVLVYTSVRKGLESARGCGKDAIRVCAIFTPEYAADGKNANKTTRGVAKLPRVYRTGTVEGVLQRVYERMREAYAVINQRVKPV